MKFLRSADIAIILRNKLSLVHLYTLTPEKKTQKSILLKDHRSLIDKGVNHKQIKLRNWSGYIDDKPYCKVVDAKLEFHSASSYSPATSLSPRAQSLMLDNQSG